MEVKNANRKVIRNKGLVKSANDKGIDPLDGAVEIIQNRLFYTAFSSDPRSSERSIPNFTKVTNEGREGDGNTLTKRRIHYFSIDNDLVYWNFFLDFGPLNLGQLYRFCQRLNNKLEDSRLTNRVICFYSNNKPEKRANAIFLICAWQVLFLKRTPQEACSSFMDIILPDYHAESRQHGRYNDVKSKKMGNLPMFHDASPCPCTYDLSILDCVQGLSKAHLYNFFNFDDFPIDEYEHYEQVEHGDLSWIIQNKIIAFAGPQKQRQVTSEGCYTLTTSDYIPYFESRKVGLVVRLNKKLYDENEFRRVGIEHVEHFYPDGSCPAMSILQSVLKDFESVPEHKAIAVHCKAGLGRTGTCIGAYLMKHYKFSAAEAIGWMRICRPGMVIGPQQHFLEDLEQRMWYEGDMMRSKPAKEKRLRTKRTTSDMEVDGESNIHGKTSRTQVNKKDSSCALGIESLSMEDFRIKQGSEAISGRAGQADALLSRRGRK